MHANKNKKIKIKIKIKNYATIVSINRIGRNGFGLIMKGLAKYWFYLTNDSQTLIECMFLLYALVIGNDSMRKYFMQEKGIYELFLYILQTKYEVLTKFKEFEIIKNRMIKHIMLVTNAINERNQFGYLQCWVIFLILKKAQG